MGARYFVAGTDTGVGKTLVTAALLEAAKQRGLRSLGLKPLAAGGDDVNGRLCNEDALMLQQHSSLSLPYQQVNPVLLQEAIAPHIAAQHEGRPLSTDRLAGFCRGAMMQPTDLLLVEGAGGWRVPLNHRQTLADLARELQLPVILVVGMRLGCLNHALLTAEAIERDGLPLAGWVANQVDPAMSCYAENRDTLSAMLRAPLLGELPFQEQIDVGACADLLTQGMETQLVKL